MFAEKLLPGDTIGIISPSHIANEKEYNKIIHTIEQLGFRVKLGKNIYKNTDGYLASVEERADDLNNMVLDDEVKMILFGGGWGASEILPLINYENIRRHPKLFSSYSDGTSILNAIYAKTGLVTYYGPGANDFGDLMHYDYMQFTNHFVSGNKIDGLCGNGEWRTICRGNCEGILIGGYTLNFALHMGSEYLDYNPEKKYLLFLEDYKDFSEATAVSVYLSQIEQYPFIQNVSGLIFGHYSDDVVEDLDNRLKRFGEKHQIPVIYTNDFGHYTRHSIMPIGVSANLNTDTQKLQFNY